VLLGAFNLDDRFAYLCDGAIVELGGWGCNLDVLEPFWVAQPSDVWRWFLPRHLCGSLNLTPGPSVSVPSMKTTPALRIARSQSSIVDRFGLPPRASKCCTVSRAVLDASAKS
jgi:hypothetical protein